MAKTLCLGLVCGVAWLASVGAGAWLLQQYGLAPRPSDFETSRFFGKGCRWPRRKSPVSACARAGANGTNMSSMSGSFFFPRPRPVRRCRA